MIADGTGGANTLIAVKIVKNLVAFGVDSIVMIMGLGVAAPTEDKIKLALAKGRN